MKIKSAVWKVALGLEGGRTTFASSTPGEAALRVVVRWLPRSRPLPNWFPIETTSIPPPLFLMYPLSDRRIVSKNSSRRI